MWSLAESISNLSTLVLPPSISSKLDECVRVTSPLSKLIALSFAIYNDAEVSIEPEVTTLPKLAVVAAELEISPVTVKVVPSKVKFASPIKESASDQVASSLFVPEPSVSTKVLPQTLESISSVTSVEPLYTTTVLSVPAAILAGLIVAALIVNVSPDASPIVVSPVVFNVVNVPAAAVAAPITTPSIAPSPPESSILTSVVVVKLSI